jgi:hypothetical protein
MEEVLDAVERMLRDALRKGRPSGVEWEVVNLYRGTDDPRNKTEALKAACLSGWESFEKCVDALPHDGPLSLEEAAGLLIHRAYLRKRRADYRDDQVARQVSRANVRGRDGEFRPFDPPAPACGDESLKKLEGLIADLLEERSVRDRLVFDLFLHGHTYEAIVEQVKAALPGESSSIAGVSRIVNRFRDELRARLEEA